MIWNYITLFVFIGVVTLVVVVNRICKARETVALSNAYFEVLKNAGGDIKNNNDSIRDFIKDMNKRTKEKPADGK